MRRLIVRRPGGAAMLHSVSLGYIGSVRAIPAPAQAPVYSTRPRDLHQGLGPEALEVA